MEIVERLLTRASRLRCVSLTVSWQPKKKIVVTRKSLRGVRLRCYCILGRMNQPYVPVGACDLQYLASCLQLELKASATINSLFQGAVRKHALVYLQERASSTLVTIGCTITSFKYGTSGRVDQCLSNVTTTTMLLQCLLNIDRALSRVLYCFYPEQGFTPLHLWVPIAFSCRSIETSPSNKSAR